jgi:hypothetical protein
MNFTVNEVEVQLNFTGPLTRDVVGYRVKMTSEDGVVNSDVRSFPSHKMNQIFP